MKLLVIGSNSNCQIRFNSPFVSSYHAELLLLDNGEILLTDKGSRNGTYLNDQRLQPNKDIPVKRGDAIRFADQLLDWQNVPSVPMPDLSRIKEMRGIGTHFRNKYQLQGDKVSRFHATLTKRSDKKWYLQDHSKNGTTVNGKAIPSNVDIKINRGDKILCAGVPVPNPYGEQPIVNYRTLLAALFVLLIAGGTVAGIYSSKGCRSLSVASEQMTDNEIYTKYKSSTVLLIGFYYYRVSAGNLDLSKLDLPTEVVISGGKIVDVNGQRGNMNIYTGTGFFVSEDGKIVTNLHIVRPWLFEDELSLISDKYKMIIASIASSQEPALNAFTSQIKVEGVLDYIGMVPNGAYFSGDNLKQCREFAVHDDIAKDVAVLQLETMRLPDNSSIVDLDHAVVDDAEIAVGSHIYTIGFPFGLSLQDLKSPKGIQLLGHGGSITQESTRYSFGFDAASYGGASGSPVFNERGQLIGILSSGVSKSQGFNYAIKASYVIELLNNKSLQ